jgi:integrase
MSHVRKSGRKAKPWRAVVTDPSVPSGSVSKTFRRRSEALDFITEQEGDKLDGTYVTPSAGQVVFRDRWDLWASTAHNQRGTTRDREESVVRSLVLPTFGDTPIGEICFDDVEAWVKELVEANYAASTIHKGHQMLAKVLGHSIKAGKLKGNAALGVRLPPVEVEVQRFLSKPEIGLVAESIDEPSRLWYLLSTFAGTRAEEAFALRAGRVDRHRPELDIVETVVEVRKDTPGAVNGLLWGKPKTKAGKRRIEIPAFLWEELGHHIDGMRPDQLLFTSPNGEPIRLHNFRKRIWYAATIKAGIGAMVPCERIVDNAAKCPLCRPGSKYGSKGGHYVGPNIHDLRHTAVSLWIDQGANVLQVSRRAGHSKVAFTYDRYGHIFPQESDPTMGKLDTLGRQLLGLNTVTPLHSVG